MKFEVKGRIWMETEKGMYLGHGRLQLLERIKEYGSITEAAKSMRMSYRQAWEQIDAMNKNCSAPLVIKTSGGTGGGGSLITKDGEALISLYRKVSKNFEQFMKENSSIKKKRKK